MVVRELINKIGFDVDESSLHNAEGRFKQFAGQMTQIVGAISEALLLKGVTETAVNAAVKVQTVARKFTGIFQDMSGAATEFSEQLAKTTGNTVGDVESGLAVFDAQARAFGLSKKGAYDLSTQMEALAVDYAAWANMPIEEAQNELIRGLHGSSRALNQQGFVITETMVQDKIRTLGLRASTREQMESNKAIARAAILTQQMTQRGVAGQGVKTLKEFSGATRQFNSFIKELQISIGNLLIPVITKLLQPINAFLKFLNTLSPQLKGLILTVVGLTLALGPLMLAFSAIAGLFTAMNLEMLPWLALIVAIGAAIYLLIDDFMTWQAGGKSILGKIFGDYKTFEKGWKENIKPVFEDMKAMAESVNKSMQAVADTLYGLFTGDWKMLKIGLTELTAPGTGKGVQGDLSNQFSGSEFDAAKHFAKMLGFAVPSNVNKSNVQSSYKSNVNLTFPANTSAENISAAQQAIQQVWHLEMGKEAQQVFSLYPVDH